MTIRIYLDDTREAPEGWTLARNVIEAQRLLLKGGVEAISLDHDLYHETGMVLVDWMIATNLVPREIIIHTWNDIGALRMRTALERRGYAPRIERAELHP